jgi:transposase-like protein
MISFKGRHFQKQMILQSVRWYLAYALSYRDTEEIMSERGFVVDHSTIQRWVIHFSPHLLNAFRRKKKRPGDRWRLDETYLKVKGQWKYFYRAMDKQGDTIDFLLTAKRDKKAALRFLTKAIDRNGKPGLVHIDKSGANTTTIRDYNDDHNTRVKIRQCEYLNNIVEQHHRHAKRRCRAMLGFKHFDAAQKTLASIELICMLKKGQMRKTRGIPLSLAEQFYALAA